jgi:hypothetical protein
VTRLSIRAARADVLYGLLARRLPLTREDIAHSAGIRSWTGETRETAVADLVADGRLSDDEYGRLILGPAEGAA